MCDYSPAGPRQKRNHGFGDALPWTRVRDARLLTTVELVAQVAAVVVAVAQQSGRQAPARVALKLTVRTHWRETHTHTHISPDVLLHILLLVLVTSESCTEHVK